ncbi:hypothetical protein [Wielerella bovis]|uniref:hypothetical protein n=1 Tax=Wielerella bovis TaxID=2917790 RepID=UPI002019429F|nr:hypothetical protein [Wielerella bovis]MCG7658080.1 hypothetical protein [Wielerella bovis]MCG7660302.1 hypothetical protein [Wielerella bovis]
MCETPFSWLNFIFKLLAGIALTIGFWAIFGMIVGWMMRWFDAKYRPPKPPTAEELALWQQREKWFTEWLAVLYRDNPSAMQTVLANIPNELQDDEHLGLEPDYLLAVSNRAFDAAYFTVVEDYSNAWKNPDYAELFAEMSAMWQRFGFTPNWSAYREDDFLREHDYFPIQPCFRWLQTQFLAHGAALFVWDLQDECWGVAVVPVEDKADFQAACEKWTLVDFFE